MGIVGATRLHRHGGRYVLIGIACALVNYAILLTVEYLGGHYLLGMLLAFTVVTPLAYVLHSWYTFAKPFDGSAFIRFAAGVAAAYPIALLMMAGLCSGLGLSVAIATPIATVGMFAWNFAAARWAIVPRLNLISHKVKPRIATANQEG